MCTRPVTGTPVRRPLQVEPSRTPGGTAPWVPTSPGPPRLSGGQRPGESLCPSTDHVTRASSVAACSHPASRTGFNAVAVLTFLITVEQGPLPPTSIFVLCWVPQMM